MIDVVKKERAIRSAITKVKILIGIWTVLFMLLIVLLLNRPMIDLHSNSSITIPMGTVYKDSKVTAHSLLQDKTKHIKVRNLVDTNKAGTYQITYSIKFLNGVIRKKKIVTVKDTIKPTITLDGSPVVYLEVGSEYQEVGYHALDNNDGDITKKVKVTTDVNTKQEGIYNVTYSVCDESKNCEKQSREVMIVKKADPNLKTIYLTFDDGPSQITPQILDVLKVKGVKATFFMIGKNDNYNDIIKRVYDEGHTVAIHSNTHNYNYIYSSADHYFKDLYELQTRLKNITGEMANVIRFPGGSSNTVSHFNRGIMSTLSAEVLRKGFYYFDWNIDSGDTGRIGSDAIVNNVTSTLGDRTTSVVLMHDYAANQQTADAVGRIIDYGIRHGYRFDRITGATPDVHHGVNN